MSLSLVCGLACPLGGCTPAGATAGEDKAIAQTVEGHGAEVLASSYRYPDQPPVLDARGLQSFTGRFRHQLVLLDFWASWCRRSLEEMPELARLQNDLGGDEFQVVSCNLDDAQDWSSHTVPLLQSLRANFPCVVIPQEAKKDLRAWLAPAWSYDLPARFVIDSQGRLVAQALSGAALGELTGQLRELIQDRDRNAGGPGLNERAAALRVKLIDVRRGRMRSLPETTADPADPQLLAEGVLQPLSFEIDRRLNARIAVLSFPWSRNRTRADAFGVQTAQRLTEALRREGYYDLVSPAEAERMVSSLGLSALTIDFDPSVVQGRLNCDFLILGWLRGSPLQLRQPEAAVAADGTAPTD